MTAARILFAGTPDFARESLSALIDAGMTPTAVLTQPDRPAGRGRKLAASAVKTLALEHRITVLQPATLKAASVMQGLTAMAPDVIVVAAYGLILPESVLAIPSRACVNVHASLLPRWRGAAPVQAAILAGDAESGVSLMQMDAGLDTGPVYRAQAIPIGDDETAGRLHDRLARLGGKMLVVALPDILAGRLEARPQPEDGVSYAHKFRREDARLDWQQPADLLARRVRAYNPVPGSWFELDGETVKCWRAEVVEAGSAAGSIVSADSQGIVVACSEGALRMLELQRPGRGRVTAQEFSSQAELPPGLPG